MGSLTQSEKTGLVSTFSGADVSIIFGDEYIGECMSFTVGINREAGPLYVMGRKSPIAVPKGKRGVGGSFILAQLGYDALLNYVSNVFKDEKYRRVFVRKDENIPQIAEGLTTFQDFTKDPLTSQAGNVIANRASSVAANDLWIESEPFYVDQLPPFNVTVVGVNEHGDKMGFRVYGLTILNEGLAISIDELNVEKRYTFIATGVSKMMRLSR